MPVAACDSHARRQENCPMKLARRPAGIAVVASAFAAFVLAVAPVGARFAIAAAPPVSGPVDPQGPESARAAQLPLANRLKADRAGYLGIRVESDAAGKLIVAAIPPESPALKSGVRVRDVIESIEGQPVATPEAFRRIIKLRPPGRDIRLSVRRGNAAIEINASVTSLASAGRPTTRPVEVVSLGIRTGETGAEG